MVAESRPCYCCYTTYKGYLDTEYKRLCEMSLCHLSFGPAVHLVQNHHEIEKHSYFSYSIQNWWFHGRCIFLLSWMSLILLRYSVEHCQNLWILNVWFSSLWILVLTLNWLSYNGLLQFSFPRVWTLSISQSVSLNLWFPACDSVNLSSYMILDW